MDPISKRIVLLSAYLTQRTPVDASPCSRNRSLQTLGILQSLSTLMTTGSKAAAAAPNVNGVLGLVESGSTITKLTFAENMKPQIMLPSDRSDRYQIIPDSAAGRVVLDNWSEQSS